MHDIDRTTREFETAMYEFQPESYEGEMYEGEWGETQGEGISHEAAYESWNEAPAYETGYESAAYEGESYAGEMNEADEYELAAELLEVTNEYELDQFLGKVIRRVRKLARSPIGRALGGVLKPLAKAALPKVAGLLGTAIGGPLGGMAAGHLTSAATRMFGLELEGLSGEDREFEVARRFVRLAQQATNNASLAAANANPVAAAKAAVATAAQQIAPGVTVNAAYPPPTASYANSNIPVGSRNRGTWVRRGRRIILFGV